MVCDWCFGKEMVLGSSSAVVSHDRVVTPAPKDAKSLAIVLSLRSFE